MNKSCMLLTFAVCCTLGLTSVTHAGGPGDKPMGGAGGQKKLMDLLGGMKKDGMGFPGMKKTMASMMNKAKAAQVNFNKPAIAGQKGFGKFPPPANGDTRSKEGKSTKAKK